MLSWFGDFSFHTLGSFEDRRLVGFSFLYCSTFTKVNIGFMALMVVGIQKDWGYHLVKSTIGHGYANG